MKRYGFLFGAGAELAYNLPSGGQFALDIFRQDPAEPKQKFREMRDKVDSTTSYANDWLPDKYKDKNISAFGKSVFENIIISSTVEHNRKLIIEKVNAFDDTASWIASKMADVDVDGAFYRILGREVSNIKLSQDIAYNENFNKGNQLFESHYFSSLLLAYKKLTNSESKSILGRIILSVMQLQLGALSEELTKNINDNLFGGTFRRDHEGDYHCTEDEVRGMLRDQAVKGMDNKILLGMELDIFYPETIKSFRTRHKAVNPDYVWHKLEDNAYLERIGAAAISDVDGKLHPTVAGLLMFGEEYKIRYEFPDYFLDYREMLDPSIRWTDRLESSSGEWSGNMLDFFFQMERKLLRDIKRPFKLEGITRIDETPVHKAIREALANCFANADFNFSRGIVILKDRDSIVIENPGSIITGKAQMLKGGISEPRNRTIMKMFNLIHVGERAGSGVPNIFSIWDEEGWIAPTVEEEYKPDRTRLTLAFKEKQATSGKNKRQAEKTSDKRKKQAESGKRMRINR